MAKHLEKVAGGLGMERCICNSCRQNQEAEAMYVDENVKKAEREQRTTALKR